MFRSLRSTNLKESEGEGGGREGRLLVVVVDGWVDRVGLGGGEELYLHLRQLERYF